MNMHCLIGIRSIRVARDTLQPFTHTFSAPHMKTVAPVEKLAAPAVWAEPRQGDIHLTVERQFVAVYAKSGYTLFVTISPV